MQEKLYGWSRQWQKPNKPWSTLTGKPDHFQNKANRQNGSKHYYIERFNTILVSSSALK